MAVAFEAGRVVALVFHDRQRACFRARELRVVAGFAAFPAIRKVALVFCGSYHTRFLRIQL